MGRSVKAGPTHIDKDGTRTYCGITRERVVKSLRSERGHISVISKVDAADPRSFGFILCPKCKELAGPGIRGGGDFGNVIARTMGGKKRHAKETFHLLNAKGTARCGAHCRLTFGAEHPADSASLHRAAKRVGMRACTNCSAMLSSGKVLYDDVKRLLK